MAEGIVAYGTYIPKYRVKVEEIAKAWGTKAVGEISVPWSNEDANTMAAEASLNALEQAGISPEKIDAFYFASESSPYSEHTALKAIAEVLRLKEEVEIAEFSNSPQASAAALKACLDALKAGRINYGLVAAADCRLASPGSDEERAFGAGAAAFILGKEGVIAQLDASSSSSTYVIDTWKGSNDKYIKSHDPRFTREYGYTNQVTGVVKNLMNKEDKKPGDYNQVILQPYADQRVLRGVGKKIGVAPEQMATGAAVSNDVGNTGTAAVLLGLAAALDKASEGEKILSVFYGAGIAEAMSFTVKKKRTGENGCSLDKYLASKEYIDYLNFLKLKNILEKDETPASLAVTPLSPLWWRDGASIRRLIGAKCKKCGYVNFPASIRRICVRCGGLEFEQILRSKKGKVHTYCVNIYVPPGMESPLPVIIADMDDGSRYKALGTEFKLDEIKIDLPVELVWRRLATEEGVNAYIYFFRPLRIA